MKKLTMVALGTAMSLGFAVSAQADGHTCADLTFTPAVYEMWPHADDGCLEVVTRDDGEKYARYEAEVVSQSPSGTYVRYILQDGSKTPSRKVNPPPGFEAMIATVCMKSCSRGALIHERHARELQHLAALTLRPLV